MNSAAMPTPTQGARSLRAFLRRYVCLADLRHLTTLLDFRGWA